MLSGPEVVRPLPVKVKFRPGAVGPALSLVARSCAGIPGRTLTCPGLARPLLVEIKFRPGAKGPALSLGGEKLR